MQRYVDGFVLPVPKDNVDEYRRMAVEAGEMWIEHGALEYFEGVGDDLDPDVGDETVSTFPEMAQTAPDETVVFAFIVYRSKEDRDAVNAAVMAEMEGREEVPMPFDMERMAYGGFRSLVSMTGAVTRRTREADRNNDLDELETGSIEVSRIIAAPADRIYNAFLDADALAKFSPPAGYTATYEHVEPEVGGTYRGTFTELETKESHSFGGEYVELAPHERIVQSDRFETDAAEMQSEMTVTITFKAMEVGTRVTVYQEGIPTPIPEEDAATGWGMSLENLARLVEFPTGE